MLQQGDSLTPPSIPERRPSIRGAATPVARCVTDSEDAELLDSESLRLINEYFYGVRIFLSKNCHCARWTLIVNADTIFHSAVAQ